jgi:hypothetical protein
LDALPLPPWRSCRKLVRNDCSAAAPVDELAVAVLPLVAAVLEVAALVDEVPEIVPPKSVINWLNAETRFESVEDKGPEVVPVLVLVDEVLEPCELLNA